MMSFVIRTHVSVLRLHCPRTHVQFRGVVTIIASDSNNKDVIVSALLDGQIKCLCSIYTLLT